MKTSKELSYEFDLESLKEKYFQWLATFAIFSVDNPVSYEVLEKNCKKYFPKYEKYLGKLIRGKEVFIGVLVQKVNNALGYGPVESSFLFLPLKYDEHKLFGGISCYAEEDMKRNHRFEETFDEK